MECSSASTTHFCIWLYCWVLCQHDVVSCCCWSTDTRHWRKTHKRSPKNDFPICECCISGQQYSAWQRPLHRFTRLRHRIHDDYKCTTDNRDHCQVSGNESSMPLALEDVGCGQRWPQRKTGRSHPLRGGNGAMLHTRPREVSWTCHWSKRRWESAGPGSTRSTCASGRSQRAHALQGFLKQPAVPRRDQWHAVRLATSAPASSA